MFSFVFSCVHCSLFFIWFLLLPVVFIFLRESFAVLEQCYSTAFFLKVTDFFFTLILLFFVNVHYLEDCTLRVCLQSAPLNSGFAIGSIRVLFKDLLFDSLRSSPSPPARGEGFSFFSLVSK